METTGSRGWLGVHPAVLRLLIGAALLLAFAGMAVAVSSQASAGATDELFVNSLANTDDGVCNGPPNDAAAGNCTLHEAFDQVNLGLADTIKFHPTVFPKAAPGVIDLETVGGNLPILTREVTIDNTGTAVVLDCDAEDDQSWECDWGIHVQPSHNGFDFALIGEKQFTIREIDGDGILIDGDEGPCSVPGGICSLDDIDISGVTINVNDNETDGDGEDAIRIQDVSNVNDLVITNSILDGDDDDEGDDGIDVTVDGDTDGGLTNNSMDINHNRIFGGDAIEINVDADLFSPDGLNGAGHTLLVDVHENESIIGANGDGVELNYCQDMDGDCDARNSIINFFVNDNGKIGSDDDDDDDGDAVDMDVVATEDGCAVECNEAVTVNLDVNDNAIVDGGDDDAVRLNVDVCCATSDSQAVIDVNDNEDIIGDDGGVEVNVAVNEGPDNTVEVNVKDNGEITGEGDDGIDVDAHAGSDGSSDTDSDENKTTITITGNDDISGDNGDGVDVTATSGKTDGAGDADRNETTVIVRDNGNIDGEDDGVAIDGRAGTADGPGDADDNTVTVDVSDNGSIDGSDDEGIDIDATAGHIQDVTPDDVTGDGNRTFVTVNNNSEITGHDGHGVFVDSFAGAVDSTGETNSTDVDIKGNGEITGSQSNGDGIHLESAVCCDSANVNSINISGNDDIVGQDADGIDIEELCCSVNVVSITDNVGVIKGNDENGVEISPCLLSGDPDDPTTIELADVDCIGTTVNHVTITGNDISNSGVDGILICCGLFQLPAVQAPPDVAGVGVIKSVIADNTISHNGEDGIDLDTVIGMNIEHNDIFMNGTSAQDGDNGVEIDWKFAWEIWDGANDIPADSFKVPGHFNRISQNSIWDNVGLGINLVGYNSAIDYPDDADGVGCLPFPLTPIAANDCIFFPKVLFTGGVDNKVSGSTCGGCHVELFYADETPADQTGPLGRQHGEGIEYIMTETADGSGDFSAALPCGLDPGILTATATDKTKNTSEFASNVPFPGTPPCATDTPVPTDTAVPTDTPEVPPTSTPVPPTDTPVPPTATATPSKDCGDVNDDGLVNAVDAQLILQFRAGIIDSLVNPASADVNNSGQINAIDAELILQVGAGSLPPSALVC